MAETFSKGYVLSAKDSKEKEVTEGQLPARQILSAKLDIVPNTAATDIFMRAEINGKKHWARLDAVILENCFDVEEKEAESFVKDNEAVFLAAFGLAIEDGRPRKERGGAFRLTTEDITEACKKERLDLRSNPL